VDECVGASTRDVLTLGKLVSTVAQYRRAMRVAAQAALAVRTVTGRHQEMNRGKPKSVVQEPR